MDLNEPPALGRAAGAAVVPAADVAVGTWTAWMYDRDDAVSPSMAIAWLAFMWWVAA
jgi:hypothetical protein